MPKRLESHFLGAEVGAADVCCPSSVSKLPSYDNTDDRLTGSIMHSASSTWGIKEED